MMKHHTYTADQEAFLRSIKVPSYKKEDSDTRESIVLNFNKKFGVRLGEKALIEKAKRLQKGKASSKVPSKLRVVSVRSSRKVSLKKVRWTKEMLEVLWELYQEDLSWKQRARRFNRRLGLKMTPAALQSKASSRGFSKNPPKLPSKKKSEKVENSSFQVFVNGKAVWEGKSSPKVQVRKSIVEIVELS